MPERKGNLEFHSAVGPLIEKFIEEKRACGYKYATESGSLRRLDRFLHEQGLANAELPRDLVEQWISKRRNESTRTQRTRIGLVRRLAVFVARQGHPAFTPDPRLAPMQHPNFSPHIFSHEEVQNLLKAADSIQPTQRSPLRYLVMPEVFRVLYCCGLRIGEALRLKVGDVDLVSGILTIRQSKFRKDRLVPLAPSLNERLQRYAEFFGGRDSDVPFFPSRDGGTYDTSTVYHAFRQLLWECRIAHGGRGKGPRLHDLRHTYAVHRLVAWYREGADLNAKLPVLATYMGHQSFAETQLYIRLTADVFPDLVSRLENAFGHVIPRNTKS